MSSNRNRGLSPRSAEVSLGGFSYPLARLLSIVLLVAFPATYGITSEAKKVPLSKAVRALEAAIIFRAVVIKDPRLTESLLEQVQNAPGTYVPAAQALRWKVFFAGAYIHTGASNSDLPLIVYYNPFSDVAVAGIWNFGQGGGAPNVAALCAFPATLLNPGKEPLTRIPLWLQAANPMEQLSTLAEDRMHSLAKRFPASGEPLSTLPLEWCAKEQRNLAELRLYDLLQGMEVLANAGAKEALSHLSKVARFKTSAKVRKALPRLSEEDAKALASMGPTIDDFRPVLVLSASENRKIVAVMGSILSPHPPLGVTLSHTGDHWSVDGFKRMRLLISPGAPR